MEPTTFVGLDVHKRMTSVAIAEAGRGGELRFLGEIPSTPCRRLSLRDAGLAHRNKTGKEPRVVARLQLYQARLRFGET